MRVDIDEVKKRIDRLDRPASFKNTPISRRRGRRQQSGGIFKFFGCLIITVIIILTIVYATLRFAVSPIVKKIDNLPETFPQELTLYQPENAEIELQNPKSQQIILSLIKVLPDWAIEPALKYLSDDLKSQISQNFGDNISIAKDFSVDDLKSALKLVDLSGAKSINLSWVGLDKTKEELASFYKQKLSLSEFQFKENLADYKIDLGFWKDDVFGTISLTDAKGGVGESDVNMTVNYFNQNENTNPWNQN
ncbi:MAG TPA: hypothetical protein VJB67_01340 [Patescibacteria group bacterium]|nr:hypothetical protein [Patescibacteria group bacterium]